MKVDDRTIEEKISELEIGQLIGFKFNGCNKIMYAPVSDPNPKNLIECVKVFGKPGTDTGLIVPHKDIVKIYNE